VKQPILQQREDGRSVFVTRYHDRGGMAVSAGEGYVFDVTRPMGQLKADTMQGLTEALIDTAYGAGEPNIAQWLGSKRMLAAEPLKAAAAATAGGDLRGSSHGAQPARGVRRSRVQALLEPQGSGWMLRLTQGDTRGQDYSHPVTEPVAEFRQQVIDDLKTGLAQAAWRERRPDAMAFLSDLSVSHIEDPRADYGVSFKVEKAASGNRYDMGAPVLRPVPGGRDRPQP